MNNKGPILFIAAFLMGFAFAPAWGGNQRPVSDKTIHPNPPNFENQQADTSKIQRAKPRPDAQADPTSQINKGAAADKTAVSDLSVLRTPNENLLDPNTLVVNGFQVTDKAGQPVSGTVLKSYPNGRPFVKMIVHDGALKTAETYFPSGALKSKDTGNHLIKYRLNEKPEAEFFRKDDKIVRLKKYHQNGIVALDMPLLNGLPNGIVKIYDETGRLSEEKPYIVIENKITDAAGKSQTTYASVPNGIAKIYLKNLNQILESYQYGQIELVHYQDKSAQPLTIIQKTVAGDIDLSQDFSLLCRKPDKEIFTGLFVVKAPQAMAFIPCEEGRVEGTIRYYVGGATPRLYQTIPFQAGKKTGIMRIYDDKDLQVSAEIPFINDKAEGLGREYWPTGELMYETPFKNDVREGTVRLYGSAADNPAGDVLIGEIPFKNGKRNGIAASYDILGNTLKQITYKDGEKIAESVGSAASNAAQDSPSRDPSMK